jgi:hypothetical protein
VNVSRPDLATVFVFSPPGIIIAESNYILASGIFVEVKLAASQTLEWSNMHK